LVSSLFSAPLIWLWPLASAAISNTRLVIDFEPGRAILPDRPDGAPTVCGTSLTAVFEGLLMGILKKPGKKI